ncbi:hypothetical protein F1643_01930 [Azospirillum sp. INR13]|uniref:restriction endonuclease subunit S n=1 Tax=Azospirillum sp. INR13 TaxID=2596919 RepID=UPI00189215FE|nr:restriction endonuclease subunit S [Azospirillum sp. INR13]MBF5093409.1 hypothetical protein [Azospirillum sp. INR13]
MRVPEGWWPVRLGDVARESRLRNDGSAIDAERLYGVFKHEGMVPTRDRVRGASVERCKVVKPGAFAYNPMRLNIGSIACSTGSDNVIVSPDYVVFECDPRQLDHRYLDHLRKGRDWVKFTEQAGDGGVRVRIYFDHLAEFRFLLPPLSEQCGIAEALSSVDDTITATRAVIEQNRKVRQSVLNQLLTRGIGHIRFIETEIGAIPETWRLKTLGELCSLTNGNGFRPPDWTDHGLPIIRIQNLNGSREFNHFAGTPKPKWIVEAGDLLFSWAGVRGVSFGPYIWDGPRGVLNQHIFKVHPSPDVNKFWLYHAMRLVTARIEAKAHGFKASLLHVHKSEITGQLVAVPPEREQEEVVHRLNALSQSEQCSKDTLAQLEKTKSALLSDLLTGRKRVSADLLTEA